jgi:signal transduction histidine kinase
MRAAVSSVRGMPMVLAIAATFCAAGAALYFQHRALSALDAQTRVILRQISEQTAADIAVEVHRAIDGPVFDTLTAVAHPDLRAGRLDLVAREFAEGLKAYPHVERFFVWSVDTERAFPGEALFYGRGGGAPVQLVHAGEDVAFQRDRAAGKAILAVARRHAPEQHIYVASDEIGPTRRQGLLRLFWTDARRLEYFAILGFVVDPATGLHDLFSTLYDQGVGALLQRRGGEVALGLRVIDQRGDVVFGDATPQEAAAKVPLLMHFYPVDRIATRLSNPVRPNALEIEVSASPRSAVAGVSRGYWPTVLAVMLMLVALGLTLQANRRAAELTRMQADFISHVSHQLKTPLSLLSVATETVAMDRAKSPDKLAQYLGIIREEVARLSALVQRILEYSRLQQQRGYEFERVELTLLVRETVSAFERSLSSQHFSFVVQAQSPAPAVWADPAAIEQTLVNLLDNAVKYSGSSREIVVRVGARSSFAIIEVSDRGVGIAKADFGRIFEKFYRGSGAAVHREGFGLGLSIVQELVHAHRGRVEVESMIGEGSTLRVLLPLAPAAPLTADIRLQVPGPGEEGI